MSSEIRSLNEAEVRKRLGSYTATAVTDELYDFGKMMVDEAIDRFKTLDSKATAIAAYALALITFLASQTTSATTHSWATYVPIASAIVAFSAAAIAVSALWLRRFEWYSHEDWMRADCLNDAEALRRYHIVTMWGALQSYQKICRSKASRIAIAQGLLLASVIVLVFALADAVMS
jgi:hypothetical protein